MGIRTYLNLKIKGKPQDIGKFKNLPTDVYLLDNICLGKTYFDALPDELEELIDNKSDDSGENLLYYYEYSNGGEIRIDALIALIDAIELKMSLSDDNEEPWYNITLKPVRDKLQEYLDAGIITEQDFVTYEEY